MEATFRNHLSVFTDALSLREKRGGVLASNIANAATPGFKARDIDFQAIMAARIGGGSMKMTNVQHFATGTPGSAQIGYRQPVNAALDGNTVELAVEQMEFAENSLRYQTSLTLLNRRISGVMNAMRGE